MAAADRTPRHRATRPGRERLREHVGLASFIAEPVLSPCIVRGVDVPGSTSECNRRGPPTGKPWGSLAEPTMLWPFNHFSKPRMPSRGTIETIYGMIVTQAREPLFYRDFGVPDTVDGRFDLLVLHLWMVLRRLKPMEGGDGLAQTVFDRFCDDMDANLREMGVGDLTVPKRMQAFGEAFYGRAAAYDLALAAGSEPLAQALCKNILNGRGIENARRLAVYAEAAIAVLAGTDEAALRSASWSFPAPS
jgi:cytochrome b pre-mRNA-processing protein 3